MQTNVKIGQSETSFPKHPRTKSHLTFMVQRLVRHSQPAVRLLLKQFPVLPELKWETDDAQVVGNQQNGGRTHILSGRWNAREERVKSDN